MCANKSRALADFLHLRADDDDRFVASPQNHEGHVFGGETFGLATLAAARTCPERPAHSLHMHFLRPVPADKPITFAVDRTREGRRLAHRRVEVQNDGRLFAQLIASFATPSDGPDFETIPFQPPAAPEGLRTDAEVADDEGWEDWEPDVVEWRWVETPWDTPAGTPSQYQGWVRPGEPMPDDAGLRAATIAFLSDYHSHLPVARVLGGNFEPMGYSSLDIVIWIHRDIPWNDFWLMTSVADIAAGGRALTRRHLHTRDGQLIATMMQEALIPAS